MFGGEEKAKLIVGAEAAEKRKEPAACFLYIYICVNDKNVLKFYFSLFIESIEFV